MDSREDLSARVLLKNVLDTEPLRTPVRRSASLAKALDQSRTVGSRHSLRRSDAVSPPKEILKQTFKKRVSRVSLLPSERKRLSALVLSTNRNIRTRVSLLHDDVITPRYLLRNILHTEPDVSLLAQKRVEKRKTQSPVEHTTVRQSSMELSDLPEMTVMSTASTRKGLGRKRSRRSFNVATFERKMGEIDNVEEKSEETTGELSSLSLGSTTLSFKTPYAQVHPEKTGLRRLIKNRCRISVEEFGAAVQRRKTGQNSQEVNLLINETAHSEGITLGLSNLSQPDLTSDIANQDTSIYAPLSSILEKDMASNNEGVEVGTDNGVTDQAAEEVKALNQTQELGADSQMEGAFKNHANGGNDMEVTSQPSDVKHIVRRAHRSEAIPIKPPALDDGRGYYSMGAVPGGSKAGRYLKGTPHTLWAVAKETNNTTSSTPCASYTGMEAVASLVNKHRGEAAETHSDVAAGGTECSYVHSDFPEEAVLSPSDGHSREGTSDDFKEKENSHPPERLDEDGETSASQEEENDDIPMKGPTFVQQRKWFPSIPIASPAVLSSISIQHSREGSDGSIDNEKSHPPERLDGDRETSAGQEEENDELPMKTPAFVRQRRLFPPIPTASPAVLPRISTHVAGESSTPAQPRKAQSKRKTLAKNNPSLPKSYVMGVFKHFAKTKVSSDVYPVLQNTMDQFFDRLAEDLEAYCLHAKRKTIEAEDVELLLKRQGHVNDQVPVEVLIEKYLPMEYRRLLIPVATSGGNVIPKLKR